MSVILRIISSSLAFLLLIFLYIFLGRPFQSSPPSGTVFSITHHALANDEIELSSRFPSLFYYWIVLQMRSLFVIIFTKTRSIAMFPFIESYQNFLHFQWKLQTKDNLLFDTQPVGFDLLYGTRETEME